MGLLCLVGRTAETVEKEDHRGRPLPPTDAMGYHALSIIFGTMLLGDAFEGHTIHSSLHLGDKQLDTASYNPAKPVKRTGTLRRHNKHDRDIMDRHVLQVERCRLSNRITEMLITNWRDVVRQMNNFGALSSTREYHVTRLIQRSPSSYKGRKSSYLEPRRRSSILREARDINVTPTPGSSEYHLLR